VEVMMLETKARLNIDNMLIKAGYVVQDMREFNRTASLGVAVREFQTESGAVDYLVFIDGEPIGVIEAKREDKGVVLTSVSEQSKKYAESGLKCYKGPYKIRFAYESTGVRTIFCDYDDINYRSREVFSFHKPEELHLWLKEENTLRNRMKDFPSFDTSNFRDCQITAIKNLERSFSENKPRALIQMATGAGKTYTAITTVYRLLKHAKAKRVLFLVDTKNLGEQAEGEFINYKPYDDGRLFSELYPVNRLHSSNIPKDTKVCISTIQRMYSILSGEELHESLEEETAYNYVKALKHKLGQKPVQVEYNENYPPEFFDFIIIDECHRSIYNVWQQVLDYFDAFLIGLTATPDERAIGFFNQNVVSQYSHEEAVIDGVNVGREGTYIIETERSTQGGQILKQVIQKRKKKKKKKRWEQLDEDLNYKPSQLDREVVNESQIRTIAKAFREAVFKDMFPNRKEVPKTLIFAKTDSHADDIIRIFREEFGEGNEFCKKITYRAGEGDDKENNPKTVLRAFRIEHNPRIAVTVDMIATGTDVKPIECLIFMRDVRSKNYFEQMLGRATRTLDKESLRMVSPSAIENKTGYILVDAVGVTSSDKTNSRQLERKPHISFKVLLDAVATGDISDDTLTTLAGRLIKLDKIMTEAEDNAFLKLCQREDIKIGNIVDGIEVPIKHTTISPVALAETLLNAFDEDKIRELASQKYSIDNPEDITDEQIKKISEAMAKEATKPFNNPNLRDHLLYVRTSHDQIMDTVNLDKIIFSDWDDKKESRAEETISTFANFMEVNKDRLDALQIIYNQNYKMRPLTLAMIENLYNAMAQAPYNLSTEKLWMAYSVKFPDKVKSKNIVNKLADIISLIRFQLNQDQEINPFTDVVKLRFRDWIFKKNEGWAKFNEGKARFTEEQTEWLRLIRDHIAASMHIELEDFELAPFGERGGLGKFYNLFGNEYQNIINEMNYALVA
jgi:type I restriction enzyme R subunit